MVDRRFRPADTPPRRGIGHGRRATFESSGAGRGPARPARWLGVVGAALVAVLVAAVLVAGQGSVRTGERLTAVDEVVRTSADPGAAHRTARSAHVGHRHVHRHRAAHAGLRHRGHPHARLRLRQLRLGALRQHRHAATRPSTTPTTRPGTTSPSATPTTIGPAPAASTPAPAASTDATPTTEPAQPVTPPAPATGTTPVTTTPRPAPTRSAPTLVPSTPSTPTPASAPAGPPGSGWRMVWNDEFNGSTLGDRWRVLDRSTFGDGNRQLECQMARNATVADGRLTLTARHEPERVRCGERDTRFPDGRAYSGATIETRGTASFTYGYIEMRAKLPIAAGTSQGLWPAFWLRPDDGGNGEIDVLEAIGTASTGRPDEAHLTIHHDYTGGVGKQSSTVRLPSGSLSSGYHRYGVEWRRDAISWYIDGERVWTRDRSTTPWLESTFSRPFFLRLNLAVGGGWPGSPDARTAFPQRYDVDWVRIHQR